MSYKPGWKLCKPCLEGKIRNIYTGEYQIMEHWLPMGAPDNLPHCTPEEHRARVESDLAYFATLPQGEPGPSDEDP